MYLSIAGSQRFIYYSMYAEKEKLIVMQMHMYFNTVIQSVRELDVQNWKEGTRY